MAGKAGKKPLDPVGLTVERLTLALIGNAKPDKWAKMLAEKEVHDPIDKFCATKEIKLLIVTWDASGNLVAYNTMPRNTATISSKKKSMAFFKAKPEALNVKNYRNCVFNVEYTSSPLENLSALSRGVFLPLIKNEHNRDQWSRAASQKILFEFNEFISSLYVIVGESQGKTLLPLPPPQIHEESVDVAERLNIVEQFLCGWTKQIKVGINKEPTILFKNGGNPDPLDELRFWAEKAEDLQSIQDQLNGVDIAKCIAVFRECEDNTGALLERNQAMLLADYDELTMKLRQELYAASSNVCFLKSLQREFETLRDCMEFLMLRDVFGPLIQKVLLVFKHSDCYNTTPRLQTLVQQINNSVIVQASKYISGEEVFRCLDDDNATEALHKIEETIGLCHAFRSLFLSSKASTDARVGEGAPHRQGVSVEVEAVGFVSLRLFGCKGCHQTVRVAGADLRISYKIAGYERRSEVCRRL